VVRAFPGAPVSTPLLPAELRKNFKPDKLNINTVQERLAEKGDVWAEFWKQRQKLEGAINRLSGDMARGAVEPRDPGR
jgi:DNA primase